MTDLPNPSEWLDQLMLKVLPSRPVSIAAPGGETVYRDSNANTRERVTAEVRSKLQIISQTAYKQALYDSGYGALGKVESVEKKLEGFKRDGAGGSES